jgi:hypothetical protein
VDRGQGIQLIGHQHRQPVAKSTCSTVKHHPTPEIWKADPWLVFNWFLITSAQKKIIVTLNAFMVLYS